MSVHHHSPHTSMMLSFAAEASLSTWAMWNLVLCEHASWKHGALLFTMLILLIQGLRALRAVQLIGGMPGEVRVALLGMTISVVGWIAMIVLFTLITLYPELGLSMSYLVPALLCHIVGALVAMHALRPQHPEEEDTP